MSLFGTQAVQFGGAVRYLLPMPEFAVPFERVFKRAARNWHFSGAFRAPNSPCGNLPRMVLETTPVPFAACL